MQHVKRLMILFACERTAGDETGATVMVLPTACSD